MEDQPEYEHNLAVLVYRYKRDFFFETDSGFLHEVFTICCKLNCLDIWNGFCAPKENPLSKIKRIVEQYYLTKDIAVARASKSLYSLLFISLVPLQQKRYVFEPYLTNIGRFKNANYRSSFFDTCSYDRICTCCKGKYSDIVQHMFSSCNCLSQQVSILKLTLILYNVQPTFEFTNKQKLFHLALTRRLYMDVLCEFLVKVSNINNYEDD